MGPKIAIIGGRIGGLTAAVALARKGLAVEVYEQAPVLEEVGGGGGPVAERVDGAGTDRAGWQGDGAGGEAGRAGVTQKGHPHKEHAVLKVCRM